MTNEERLLGAIGEIDEELIREASSSYKKTFTPLTRGLTVAASIALTSAIIIASSGLFAPKSDNAMIGGADFSDGSSSPNAGSNTVYIESELGYIYDVRRVDENKISFEILLEADVDEPLYVKIFAYDEAGVPRLIATNDKTAEGYDPTIAPSITVNLEAKDNMPTAGGKYFVTVDLGKINDDGYPSFNYIEIDGFGKVYKNPI